VALAVADFLGDLADAARRLAGDARAGLIADARAERDRLQAQGISPRVVVDGQEGRAIEQVQPGGSVVFLAQDVRPFVARALAALERRSPRVTGRFAGQYRIVAGGREYSDPEQLPEDTRSALLFNREPYARRLEVGRSPDGTPFVVSAEPGFIRGTALLLRRRFGRLARVRAEWIDRPGQGRVPGVRVILP